MFMEMDRLYPVVHLDAYTQVVVDTNNQVIQELNDMASLYKKLVAGWKSEGKAEGKAEALLTVLQNRFKRVPKSVQDKIHSYTDLTALDSLLQAALDCKSLA
jgi:hypothetical protein